MTQVIILNIRLCLSINTCRIITIIYSLNPLSTATDREASGGSLYENDIHGCKKFKLSYTSKIVEQFYIYLNVAYKQLSTLTNTLSVF